MMHTPPTSLPPIGLSIIGPGRVGKTLGRLLRVQGAAGIVDVLGRRRDAVEGGVAFIGGGRATTDFASLVAANVYLLAVPDDAIAACCARLVACVPLQGAIVFHCSGALTSDQLHAARQGGATVASVHPVRSFADPDKVAGNFASTRCGVEGDPEALAVLIPMFEAIGAVPVPIDSAAKTLYHAAAVFGSNYVVTLIDVAMQAYANAGIAPAVALGMIAPLLLEAADNAFRLGPAAALTGPVARGDTATVALHERALAAWDPALGELYAALAKATATVADRRRHDSATG